MVFRFNKDSAQYTKLQTSLTDNTVPYNTVQYNTTQHNIYNTIQHNTVQYNTVQYSDNSRNTLVTERCTLCNLTYAMHIKMSINRGSM